METLSRRINNTFGTLSAFKGKHGKQTSLSTTNGPTSPEDFGLSSPPPITAEFVGKMDLPTSFNAVTQSPSAASVHGHMRSASGASTHSGSLGLGNPNCGGATSRSLSMNSVSSEGSNECSLVEQEVIVALTASVRAFKEALSKLRRIFHPEREKQEILRVVSHERLGEILRILRVILEKYPPLQSTELLMAAGHLIQQVKNYNYEDDKCNPAEFFEVIDQLALAFSSRVSEYLMGDIDTSSAVHSATRTRSCENLLPGDAENFDACPKEVQESEPLSPEEIDEILMKIERGVEVALHRAKLWSKYAKDVITYIDKRANLEAEYSRSLLKLAQNMRQSLKEQSCLPFQSIYCTALDEDTVNANDCLSMCTALQENKFVEPLTARRNEHERQRKLLKEMWQRDLKKTQEAVVNLRKARSQYIQRNQEYEKAKESLIKAENNEANDGSKIDKKKKIEDEANQKVLEAEALYKSCVEIANDRHQMLKGTKGDVLKQVRELMLQCDQTMKAVSVSYFQMQHTFSAPAPVQFQTLCESSRLYEPGSQYLEFVKRFFGSFVRVEHAFPVYTFERYSPDNRLSEKERKSTDSSDATEDGCSPNRADGREKASAAQPAKVWSPAVAAALGGSDSDSIGSSQSNKSRDTSPSASPQVPMRRIMSHASSGDELDADADGFENGFALNRRVCLSKAAATHAFRKLKTLAKCRECDTYVYFQGVECCQCGLACHKKCLEALAIQCGHKKLPRKMTTFGVDLCALLHETRVSVPYLVTKCVHEIDQRGILIKGIYRVSGVKSRIEKLCQSFENGANLVDLSDIHPNVIANVLKLYLRQLPEPLLTFRLYPEFIRIAKDYQTKTNDADKQKLLQELHETALKLPQPHRLTLATLMHHLKRVADVCDENNMPPSNLGIVFGPTLLRTREGGASLASLVDTVHQAKTIELLIVHATEIFGADVRDSDRISNGHRKCPSNGEPKLSVDEIDVVVVPTSAPETELTSTKCKAVVGRGSLKTQLASHSAAVVTIEETERHSSTSVFTKELSSSLEEWNEMSLPDGRCDSLSSDCSPEKQSANGIAVKDAGSLAISESADEQCGKPLQKHRMPAECAVVAHLPLTRATSSQTGERHRGGAATAPTLSSSGSVRQGERCKAVAVSGVGTQTDVSFLRNLAVSPIPRKCPTASLGPAKLGQSDVIVPAPTAPAGRIVIHVAGVAEESGPPPVQVKRQLVSRETQSSVESETVAGSKTAPARLLDAPSESASTTPASETHFSVKRLAHRETRDDEAAQANLLQEQDFGIEDTRPSPDGAPGRYVSPYLSDDPYKKYRLGVGSSLPISKMTTFANYDVPLAQSQAAEAGKFGSDGEAAADPSAGDDRTVEKHTTTLRFELSTGDARGALFGRRKVDGGRAVMTTNRNGTTPRPALHAALEGRRSLPETTLNGVPYSATAPNSKVPEAGRSADQSKTPSPQSKDSAERAPHYV